MCSDAKPIVLTLQPHWHGIGGKVAQYSMVASWVEHRLAFLLFEWSDRGNALRSRSVPRPMVISSEASLIHLRAKASTVVCLRAHTPKSLPTTISP